MILSIYFFVGKSNKIHKNVIDFGGNDIPSSGNGMEQNNLYCCAKTAICKLSSSSKNSDEQPCTTFFTRYI